jgi:hypothetical protein
MAFYGVCLIWSKVVFKWLFGVASFGFERFSNGFLGICLIWFFEGAFVSILESVARGPWLVTNVQWKQRKGLVEIVQADEKNDANKWRQDGSFVAQGFAKN